MVNEKIRQDILDKGYGLYFVVLRPRFFIESTANMTTRFAIRERPGANHRLEDRMITGTHRKNRDVSEEYFRLEIIRDFDIIIPYTAIIRYEKLRELPF